jgi:hypothetical protein
MITRFFASRSKWPRLRSATGPKAINWREKNAAEPHFSPSSKNKTNGHRAKSRWTLMKFGY